LDRRYAALLVARGSLAFALAIAAAWLWRDPAAVLFGSAVAAAGTLALVRERGRTAFVWGAPDRRLLARFAGYALPLVAAGAIYQFLPLLNRSVLAGRSGFAEAGYFSLASEVAVRLFQNLGAALDLALFQLAVRAEEREGRQAAERQISRNLGLVLAILLPAAVGLAAVWPSFEALLIPASFQGEVAGTMMLAIPAFAAYALVQYGLNPIFQIRGRTGPVIAAALVALAVNGAFLLAWPGAIGALGMAAVQAIALGAGLLAITALAVSARAVLPWRDLAFAAFGAAIMGAVLWPWREALPPLPGLLAQVLVGCLVYGAVALVFDVAGARSAVTAFSGRRRKASSR
jgi:O-antigen/teichoic acid export membrane protein